MASSARPQLQEQPQEDFGARCTELLNSAAVVTALGFANRTGLLAALLAADAPATSAQLAAAAGISERYAREALAVLLCGNIVTAEAPPSAVSTAQSDGAPSANADAPSIATARCCGTAADAADAALLYSLPAHRRGPLSHMGPYFEELPLVCACSFLDVAGPAARTGRGVPAAQYAEFHGWMGRLADAKHERLLLSHFVPAAAGGALAAALAAGGARVADIGCGRGSVVIDLAHAFPGSEFVGIDINPASISAAREKAAALPNARFVVRDAAALASAEPGLVSTCDFVLAFDAVHDTTQPLEVLRSARALLKPGGALLMVDIRAHSGVADNTGHGFGPFLYAVSLMHCMPSGAGDDGRGDALGMMWGRDRALGLLKEAGFEQVTVEEMPFDTFNDLFVAKA